MLSVKSLSYWERETNFANLKNAEIEAAVNLRGCGVTHAETRAGF
jgi:hypothetical protein